MQKLLVITGPTAVGKSEIALELAAGINAEIISADSVQVYRGFDIGTAKPTPAERSRVRHHLLDIVDPSENYTVADFQKDAFAAIRDISGRGKLPMLVGGTGLYIRAVVRGFAFSPAAEDEKLRRKLYNEAKLLGPRALHERLSAVDPLAAQNIHPNDLRRIIRALEVHELTRRPISEQVQQTPVKPVFDTVQFCLTRPRKQLYERIEKRVDKMLADGFLTEVRKLLAQGISPRAKAMQSLGYRQLVSYLEGKITLAEAVELIKGDTRRFAKRQLTWFRREPDLIWIDLDKYDNNFAVTENISTYLAGYYQIKKN
jgi:tRNA dimethylallyltransferase